MLAAILQQVILLGTVQRLLTIWSFWNKYAFPLNISCSGMQHIIVFDIIWQYYLINNKSLLLLLVTVAFILEAWLVTTVRWTQWKTCSHSASYKVTCLAIPVRLDKKKRGGVPSSFFPCLWTQLFTFWQQEIEASAQKPRVSLQVSSQERKC